MPVAVALSQWIGVGDCRCLSSRNVSLTILASFALNCFSLIAASAADAATNLSIWHSVNIAPFR